MQYPTKIKEVAEEIIKACNAYKARKLKNEELREVIFFYAKNYPEKMFNADDINPTIKKVIGKQRVTLLNKILNS